MGTKRRSLKQELKENREYVAALIRAARQMRGMDQKALAKAMKTTQSSISRFESGTEAPTLDSLGRMADAMGCRLVVNFE